MWQSFFVPPLVVLSLSGLLLAQPPGRGPVRGSDERHHADHEVLHCLLENHTKILRTVRKLDDGVEALTESDDPEVPQLIQAHAEVVFGFVKNGFAEAMKNHAVPNQEAKTASAPIYPKIAGYGKVIRLPNAAQQPRDGTKICVDVTGGGEPEKLWPSIEKLARYVNIYAAAGAAPAQLDLAVVLHGEATLAALHTDAFAAKFGSKGNPNFELLHELHEHGVKIYVCGQSLVSKGANPDDVMLFVDVAVSALTAVVNYQMDGFAIVRLR